MTQPKIPLPEPDLTMPSIVPDGPNGAHFYRASTVQELLVYERGRWLYELSAACESIHLPGTKFADIVRKIELPEGSKQVAELLRERDKALAQLRHLVDDLTHCPNPTDPDKCYVRPGAGLLFSNMVNAVARMLARIDKEEGRG